MPKSLRRRRRTWSSSSGTKRRSGAGDLEAAKRTSPTKRHYRYRSTWKKIVGAISVILGVSLILVNFADEDLGILPGGHSILYFLGGLVIALSSFWWFGAFDPP